MPRARLPGVFERARPTVTAPALVEFLKELDGLRGAKFPSSRKN